MNGMDCVVVKLFRKQLDIEGFSHYPFPIPLILLSGAYHIMRWERGGVSGQFGTLSYR